MNYFTGFTSRLEDLAVGYSKDVANRVYDINEYENRVYNFHKEEQKFSTELKIFIDEFNEKVDELNEIDFEEIHFLAQNWEEYHTLFTIREKIEAVADRVDKIDLIYDDMNSNYSHILNAYQNAYTATAAKDECLRLLNECRRIRDDLHAEYEDIRSLKETLTELIDKNKSVRDSITDDLVNLEIEELNTSDEINTETLNKQKRELNFKFTNIIQKLRGLFLDDWD